MLLFVSVWFIRWRKNSFWLVRKATSQDEVYYLAHSSLPYSGLNVLMCLGLQGFAWYVCDAFNAARSCADILLQVHVRAGERPTGTCVPLLDKSVLGPRSSRPDLELLRNGNSLYGHSWRFPRRVRTRDADDDAPIDVLHLRSYADKRAPRFASPWVLLGSFIATSIAFLASSLPPVVKSAKAYSDTMLDWVAIDEMLGEAASLYAGTASASSAAVANSIAPRLFALIARKQRLYRLFRLTYLLYAAWAFLLGGTFCVFGIAYARAVKRSLNEFKDRSPTASTVFSQTVRNLIALLLGFTLFIVVVSVNSIWYVLFLVSNYGSPDRN